MFEFVMPLLETSCQRPSRSTDMKSLAIGVALAATLILAAEWFFQTLEVRPPQYLAMANYN